MSPEPQSFLFQLFIWVSRAVFLFIVCVAILGSLSSSPAFPLEANDKVNHAVGYAVLTLIAFAAWPSFRKWVAVFAFLFGIAIECIQIFLPSREFGVEDLLANLVGITFATGVAWLVKTYWPKKRTNLSARQ